MMDMLLVCAVVWAVGPGIPNLVKELPPPQSVRIARAASWSIGERPLPKTADSINGWKGEVNGRIVQIDPPKDGSLDAVQVGRDGSLHIRRAWRQISWWNESSIFWDGRETRIDGDIDVYHDRSNYLASVTETNAIGMPMEAPVAYAVRGGRRSELGPGRAIAWEPDGLIVLSVPVDDEGRPAGYEFATSVATRLLSGDRSFAVMGFGYLGRRPDGSVLLGTRGGYGRSSNGFVYSGSDPGSHDELLVWRAGRIVERRRFPEGWQIEGASPAGWLLMRRWPVRPAPDPTRITSPDTFIREAERSWEQKVDDEKVWEMGRYENGTITPIRFRRPAGTEGLLWRGTIVAEDSVLIHTFYGDTDRHFRLRPR